MVSAFLEHLAAVLERLSSERGASTSRKDSREPWDSDGALNERVITFVRSLHDRYAAYHNHKETMAYTALGVYVAAFGTALISKDWPPMWGPMSQTLAALAITAAWIAAVVFVRWQLRRRRWAAIRLAGTERLLAKWINTKPTRDELAVWTKSNPEHSGFERALILALDHLFPQREAVITVDVGLEVYPRALVIEWKDRESSAITHEYIVSLVMFALWLALVVRILN